MEYHHTQTGTVVIAALGTAIAFTVLPSLMNLPFHPIQTSVVIVLVIALGLFYSLTVEIKENTLKCYFRPGLISRKISLSDIVEARAVHNS